ncbi:5-carboxymethyl-2-hydroxymuconate Delta-isomerase [Magnetovibrio sp. PR-2]|uniref:5-carboxymethyl-2-hydroxymuconate Delta-isomerase n=1 Tax=Magnetovibrio sp. PR-2 TaxID=3120356 RepID=UPI002FCE1FCA
MPHLIVEYAKELEADLDIQALAEAVYDGAVESELFTPQNVKARCTPVRSYCIGGERRAFIHVNVKLQPGRTDVQKKMLSEKVFAAVKYFAGDVKVSVEVNDLPQAYTKS